MAQPPNPFEQQSPIPGVKNIIVVGAGKGGVGKSTVAVNAAIAMAQKGAKVGLLDADIYGPSLTRMIGALNQKPPITAEQKIKTIDRYGIRTMSIGYLIPEARSLVWRGPLLFKTMDQFFRQVEWGELDVLVIDLPPGTGDVPLSVAQKVPVRGAIGVCTPQNVALMDLERAVNMFETLSIPLLGMVENMSGYRLIGGGAATAGGTTADQILPLFPRGDLDAFLDRKRIPRLAQLAFSPELAQASEIGVPLVVGHPKSTEAQQFTELATKILQIIG